MNDVSVEGIFFRSSIEASYRGQLERLFFFNPAQAKCRARIEEAIDIYGKPVLLQAGDRIRLAFERPKHGQALHVFRESESGGVLIGAVLYVRDSHERITVAHFVLRPLYSNDPVILSGLIRHLRVVFRRIKGIESFRIFYSGTTIRV